MLLRYLLTNQLRDARYRQTISLPAGYAKCGTDFEHGATRSARGTERANGATRSARGTEIGYGATQSAILRSGMVLRRAC
eukprot:3940748-Rhodomonas_salina.3